VTRGQLPQRAGSLGLNGGGAAAAVPPVEHRDTTESQRYMAKFGEASKQLVEDPNLFIKSRSESNENFKFWLTFLDMMDVVHDLLEQIVKGIGNFTWMPFSAL